MERGEELERISNRIRCGEPVGFLEAIAAIDYQHSRQEYLKQQVWWRRLLRWMKGQAQ